MASSSTTRLAFRVVLAISVLLLLFYVGRPLYWKISATVQEIRENKQTVKQGISQIVYEAQKGSDGGTMSRTLVFAKIGEEGRCVSETSF